jgi:hypothetical protein
MLVPGSLAIISASFSKEERGRAIGTWSGFTAIAAGVGPVLGGWLIEHVSWRWIFFINLPLAAVVLAITWWRVPESRDESAGERVDVLGAATATLGLGGVVYGLLESGVRGFADVRVARVSRGSCAARPLRRRRAQTRRASDDAARPLPLADFRGGEPFDALPLRRAERVDVLPALQPDSGAGLFGDRGGGRAPARSC